MIFQFDISGYQWMIGIGIMFGLALVMNVLTFNKATSFFVWLTIFSAFVVWGGLLPLWTLVMCLIVLTVVIYMELQNKGGIKG